MLQRYGERGGQEPADDLPASEPPASQEPAGDLPAGDLPASEPPPGQEPASQERAGEPLGSASGRPVTLIERVRRRPARWLGLAMLVTGLGMIPWLAGLAIELPASARAAHWAAAWTGLDSLEALGLAATGLLLLRRNARYRLAAMATGTLLTVDAWFDIMTSAAGADRTTAITMAAFPELPVAALCAVLAFRRFPPGPAGATEAAALLARRRPAAG